MSTTVIAAGAAAASASANAANAATDAARRTACMAWMRGYQHDAAGPTDARHYARCVELVYGLGDGLPADVALALKAAFLLVVVGGPLAAWIAWREDGDAFETAMAGALGLIAGPCAAFVAWLLYAGAVFFVS